MNRDTRLRHGQWLMLALILAFITSTIRAQTTAFTYQGKLNDGGLPASGTYDLEFKLFDALSGGAQVGATVTRDDVPVTGGIFSVPLDFGAGVFTGADRWLEISVRAGASTGAYTTLTPRQPLTPTPYAIRSQSAAAADTADNATNATTATTAGSATNFSGPLGGDVTGAQGSTIVTRLQTRDVANTAPTNGQILKYNSSASRWEPGTDNSGSVTAPLVLSGSNAGPIVSGTNSGAGAGAYGNSGGYGVHGESSAGSGVFGQGLTGLGVSGTGTTGVYGAGSVNGVQGFSAAGTGISGTSNAAGKAGVYGESNQAAGYGVHGKNTGGGKAGYFEGDVQITGSIAKGSGSFKIDHPLDPANKYLYHSFIESPDMKNVYDGVAVCDARGEAIVTLPDWFQALNRDFRYQLTCIGGYAPVYVAEEMANNHFKIAGGAPGMKVSWQLTGIRQDPYANANRIPVEQEKPAHERGSYLHPQAYGQTSGKTEPKAPSSITRQ